MDAIQIFGTKLWSGIMGLGRKRRNRKIMLNYIRWIFKLDFCIPRYVIMRELVMDKLKVGWSLRARKYEKKIKSGNTDNLVREC